MIRYQRSFLAIAALCSLALAVFLLRPETPEQPVGKSVTVEPPGGAQEITTIADEPKIIYQFGFKAVPVPTSPVSHQIGVFLQHPEGGDFLVMKPGPSLSVYVFGFPIEKEFDGYLLEAFLGALQEKCPACNPQEAEQNIRNNLTSSFSPESPSASTFTCGACSLRAFTHGKKIINIQFPS